MCAARRRHRRRCSSAAAAMEIGAAAQAGAGTWGDLRSRERKDRFNLAWFLA